jgi:non-homologous end joining protein Ku
VALAKQVIATFDGPLDLADYKDEYREGLQRIIDAKNCRRGDCRADGRGACQGRQSDGPR